MSDSKIVCTLGPEALKARQSGLLSRVGALSTRIVRMTAGYRFEFASDGEILPLLAGMIDAERQCCRFLRFELIVEPDAGPISLEVTGPPGTLEFLDALAPISMTDFNRRRNFR
jgi:hypothetical protein